MSKVQPEQRAHPRVDFLLVPVRREQLPVWIFRPEDAADACTGLVVNAGSGGLQILVNAEAPPAPDQARLRLILAGCAGLSPYEGEVERVWSRPLSHFAVLHGYRFLDEACAAQEFLATFRPSLEDAQWVRCTIGPR